MKWNTNEGTQKNYSIAYTKYTCDDLMSNQFHFILFCEIIIRLIDCEKQMTYCWASTQRAIFRFHFKQNQLICNDDIFKIELTTAKPLTYAYTTVRTLNNYVFDANNNNRATKKIQMRNKCKRKKKQNRIERSRGFTVNSERCSLLFYRLLKYIHFDLSAHVILREK